MPKSYPLHDLPPDDSLASAIVAFGRLLKDHGLSISLPAIMDALYAVVHVGVQNPADFRTALQACFVKRAEESAPFDRLFKEFWVDRLAARPDASGEGESAADDPQAPDSGGSGPDLVIAEAAVSLSQEEEARQSGAYVAYSPMEALREMDFRDTPDERDERMAALIREIVAPLLRRLSVGRRPTLSGSIPDFRKLFRRNVRYGGEIWELPMAKTRPRVKKLVFLCDVSGSMNAYLRFMLRFIREVQGLPTSVETFVFATRLSRVTPLLTRLPFKRALEEIGRTVKDWRGGTRIGECLHQFNVFHGGALLRSSTVVLIFSDGWDRGDPKLLEREMTRIHSRSYRVLWINPLLGGPSYEPTCRGMRTALPYVDSFLPGHNISALERLARALRGILG